MGKGPGGGPRRPGDAVPEDQAGQESEPTAGPRTAGGGRRPAPGAQGISTCRICRPCTARRLFDGAGPKAAPRRREQGSPPSRTTEAPCVGVACLTSTMTGPGDQAADLHARLVHALETGTILNLDGHELPAAP